MSANELNHFIESCQKRNIRFTSVELTGGEPTLWPLFSMALERLVAAKITEQVTFITNGNDPSVTARLANRFTLRYMVSATQATAEQQDMHAKIGVGVQWNNETHKCCPSKLIPDTLPAQCSQRQLRDGQVSRELLYLAGQVWYCCTAAANAIRLRQEEPSLSCSFEEDFNSYFADKQFDKRICSICLSNKKVWDII
jgi:organic radical activating enzyme